MLLSVMLWYYLLEVRVTLRPVRVELQCFITHQRTWICWCQKRFLSKSGIERAPVFAFRLKWVLAAWNEELKVSFAVTVTQERKNYY